MLHYSLQCYYTDRKDKNFKFKQSFSAFLHVKSCCPCESVYLPNTKAASAQPCTYSHHCFLLLSPEIVLTASTTLPLVTEQHNEVHPSGSYTPTILCRYVLYLQVATGVYGCVQDSKVLKCSRSAAAINTNFVLAALLSEALRHHVLHD